MLQKLRELSKARLVCAVLALLLVLLGAYFFLAQQASRQAANIFNHFMHKQQVLVGRVTTKELRADIWGNVYFTELCWESPRGETLLEVPEGRLKIKPWDIVLRRAGINTIEEVELHKAYVHLGFDDRMRLEVLQRDAKKPAEGFELDGLPDDERHLQLPQRLPNIKLLLQDTVLEADYKQRCFILHDVSGYLQIRKHNRLELSLSAGEYGGSIAGKGLNIDGHAQLDGQQ